ncbi:LuxR C-terminal-related transcriptional regulator [Janibacter sp. G368]|uniref:helix-turn-helix transcriptional regulator n=1 Tax=Janibacter sp. G368 TaxID=3420441 RepID=UPI003D01950D
MRADAEVFVWSRWRLHADAVTSVLVADGLDARTVASVDEATGLLVGGALLPDLTDLLERRRSAGLATVVWGGVLPSPRVAALRQAGAAAYVSMLEPPQQVVDVVRRVLAGQPVPWPQPPEAMVRLTEREQEVARAYLADWSDHPRAEVARRLGISERTLKVHIANIRAKAGHRGTETREGLRRALVVSEWL